MRRAVPAAITTVLGLIALASFKSSPGIATKSASAQSLKPTTPVATAPPATTTPTTTTPNTTSGSGRSTATTPTTTPSTTTPTTTGSVRKIDGQPVDNQYGTVQVEVTLQGNQITNVTTLQMPYDHQRSAEISQQVEPILSQEVLQAQSAQIDLVSGATYTSQSYAQSLQSALDQARR